MNSSLSLMETFANPISVDVTTAPDNFQLELLDMQSDIELRQAFNSDGLLSFWRRVPDGKYPNLIANALKQTSLFGSTYVCEALFSKMVRIKNQYRNRLTDDHLKQLLRPASSMMNRALAHLLKVGTNVKLRTELVFILIFIVLILKCLSFVSLLFRLALFVCDSLPLWGLRFCSGTKKG